MNQRAIFAKIGFNTIIQIAGKAISVLLGFITVALLTRYLGVAGYGNFTLVFAYLSFFGIIADFGLQLTIVRELSQQKEKHHLLYGTYFWLKLLLVVISSILALLILLFFPYSIDLKIGIAIGALAVSIGNLSNFGTAIFQSNLRLDLVTLVDVITKIITVSTIVLFVALKLNFYYIISSVLIGNLFGFILTILILRKLMSLNFSYDIPLAKRIFILSLPIGFTSLIYLLYFKIDTVILSIMRSSIEVGIYSLSYKILENVLVLWGFYMASFYPILSNMRGNNDDKNFIKLFKNSLIIILGFSLIITISGFIYAPLIIDIFGGEKFASSILSLRILLFSVPLFFITNLFYHLYLADKRNNIVLFGMMFSLIINFILNLIFVPKGGYIAASYITIVGEIVLLLFYLMSLRYSRIFK